MSKPLLHFLGLGAVLLALDTWLLTPGRLGSAAAPRERITVSRAQVEELRASWASRFGAPPTARELAALIRAEVDQEILLRRGIELGLHHSDPVVYRRLVQNMQFLAAEAGTDLEDLHRAALVLGMERSDPVARRRLVQRVEHLLRKSSPPLHLDDEQLAEYVRRHAERFTTPARAQFRQVFLSADRRGASLEADARRLVRALRQGATPPEQCSRLSDPSLLPSQVGPAPSREIAGMFGPAFAQRVMELEAGAWHGPIRSAYGLHLVWVDEIIQEALPPFDQIRERARLALRQEREDEMLRTKLGALRRAYQIEIEAAELVDRVENAGACSEASSSPRAAAAL